VGVAIATQNEGTRWRVFPRLASNMRLSLGSYRYPVTRKRRCLCTRSAQVRAKSLSRVLLSRVTTCRVARSTVSWDNTENRNSSTMWRVASGMELPSRKRQRLHAYFGVLRVCSIGFRREGRLRARRRRSRICAWKGRDDGRTL
jgi:hypothetical protein